MARFTDSGDLDATFGSGAVVVSGIASSSDNSVAIDPVTGKIVVFANTTSGREFVRFLPNGTLDATFGSGGKVAFDHSLTPGQNDLAIDGSENLLLGGYVYNASTGYDLAVARYNADGSLDTTNFGTGGVASVDLGSPYDIGSGVALDRSGRILLTGLAERSDNIDIFALARLTSAGSVDAGFGTRGRVENAFGGNDFGYAAAVDPTDGDIVVFAQTSGGSDFVRYRPDGTLDTSFGSGTGRVAFDYAVGTNQYNLTIDGSGRILVAGTVSNGGTGQDFAVARYNADGSLDTSFGDGAGKVAFDLGLAQNDYAYAVAVDAQDRILLTGYTYNTSTDITELGLMRLTADGSLDGSFDRGGIVVNDLTGNDYGQSAAVDPITGDIVVFASTGSGREFVRYLPDGTLDTTFGGGTGQVAVWLGHQLGFQHPEHRRIGTHLDAGLRQQRRRQRLRRGPL